MKYTIIKQQILELSPLPKAEKRVRNRHSQQAEEPVPLHHIKMK